MRKNIEISEDEIKEFLEQFYGYFENGYAFEEFLKVYLEKIGLDEVIVTQRSSDGGIDLEAIRYETSIIRNTCMEDYFLLNYYIIKRAKELGMILTQTGRGSAVSFLNNKLLGFTEVDRLQEKVQLYPTRFMSESRILQTRSLPDKKLSL